MSQETAITPLFACFGGVSGAAVAAAFGVEAGVPAWFGGCCFPTAIAAACPSSQLSQNSSILVSVFLFHDPSSLFLLLSAFFSVVFFFLFASPLYL